MLVVVGAGLFACENPFEKKTEVTNVSCDDLSGVCPPNSFPVASKDVEGSCGAHAEFKPESREVALGGYCTSKGSCQVVCLVTESQCGCGVDTVTKDEVKCLACPTCGNGIKEPGEDCDLGANNGSASGCSTTCYLTGCPEHQRKCSGNHVQFCTSGTWNDEEDCGAKGMACRDAACVQTTPPPGDPVPTTCSECAPESCIDGTCYSSFCCTPAGSCLLFSLDGNGPARAPLGNVCTCTDFVTGTTFVGAMCASG